MSGVFEVEKENAERNDVGGGGHETVEKSDEKYQQLKSKLEEYFDDEHGKSYRIPPMARAPPQPTKEEFDRHQTTHITYALWCKLCLVARATRTQHPSKGREAIILPDVDTGVGPIKLSTDYVCFHERRGKYRETAYNPPHMIMIEHTKGRCWAYNVPSNGIFEEAYWLPERMAQDLDNMGLRHHKIQLNADQEPAIVSVQKVKQ